MKELQHLNKYFLKYKKQLLIGVVITIAARLFLLYTPRYVKQIFIVIENYSKNTITKEVFKVNLSESIIYIIGAAII